MPSTHCCGCQGAGLCVAYDVDYIVVNADEVDLGGTEVVQRGVIVCAAPGAMVCQTTSLGMKPNTSCGIQLVEGDALHAHRAHHGSGGAPSSCGGGFAPGPRQKTNLSWIGKQVELPPEQVRHQILLSQPLARK